MTQVIEVEADSLEEARNEVMSRTPVGLQLLSETIISDGKSKFVGGYGATIEAAFAEAQKDVPDGAFDLQKKEIESPENMVITADAFDETSARYDVERQLPAWRAEIKSLNLAVAGSKGFLGIGKKPTRYEAEVFRPAYVEIHYNQKAKISAKVGYANRGMRQDTMSQATAYWMARMSSVKKDPFVMYTFANASDARAALLDLYCIHEGEDGLICTETLTFGHYQRDDGITEAIVCGDDLTHDLWAKAHDSFAKHGGTKKNDLEPEERSAAERSSTAGDAERVVFVREDRAVSQMGTGTSVYRIYSGPDAASAKAFLDQNPVTEALYYIVVETPKVIIVGT